MGINLNGGYSGPLVGYSASLPWVRAEASINIVNTWTKTTGNHTINAFYSRSNEMDRNLGLQSGFDLAQDLDRRPDHQHHAHDADHHTIGRGCVELLEWRARHAPESDGHKR